MKTEIKKILYKFLQDGISSDDVTQQVFDVFSVRLSLLAEKSADEATERYEHIRGADYANGLEQGFESGAEWIFEEIIHNKA